MSNLLRPAIALLLLLSAASPALARMAMIEASVPLENHSEKSIKTSFREAVHTAVRGAMAMGLPRIQIRDAFVLEGMLTVLVLATDEQPEEEEPMAPGLDREAGTGAHRPLRFEL